MNNIECQICCCEFDECRHRPRILLCGHTFCSICLKSLLINGEITCPNCQKIHAADNVENININFLIESILSPDDQNKAVELDKGYKCEEHCYELNFFCESHEQWICRDCTVIKHKPCNHSLDCNNENDCRVVSKKERLDKIKAEKINKVKRFDDIYGISLKNHVNEYRSELSIKLSLREDLKKRLKNCIEENDSEIEVLTEKLCSKLNIESTIIENKGLVKVAQDEMIKAQKRDSVEESCKILDKTIGSAYDWHIHEVNSIIKEKKVITEVEISLKEMEKLKQKLSVTESNLYDSKDEIEDLNCKIEEYKSTTICLTSRWEESEKKILDLEYKIKRTSDQSVKDWDEKLSNKMKIDSNIKRISELETQLNFWKEIYKGTHTISENKLKEREENILQLENKLKESNDQIIQDDSEKQINKENIDGFKARISELEKQLNNIRKQRKVRKKTGKPLMLGDVETQNVFEVKNHLLNQQEDCFLVSNIAREIRYGRLALTELPHTFQKIVLVESLQHSSIIPPPGSMILGCYPMTADMDISDIDFVYLDIGIVDIREKEVSTVGSPLVRLLIQLETSPMRKQQMVQICCSISDESWRFCNFNIIRNEGQPGESVTCKSYRKFYNEDRTTKIFERWYNDLEYDGEEHLISGGKVFGYIGDSAGFSIITRHKYGCETRWPLLGHVVSGLETFKEVVMDYDVHTIGIHSHGVGFLT